MVAASLRALLANSIDYAGLFPPTDLALAPALTNHAEYVRSPDSWMLGAFILPISQFENAAANLSGFDRQHPLRVSTLGPKPAGAASFDAQLQEIVSALRTFGEKHREIVSITQFEMVLPMDFDAKSLSAARSIFSQLQLRAFWESPADDAERAIALLAEHNASVSGKPFGFKLRTGGVTAEAFPTSDEIATALATAAEHRVPIKFTAGLHHPVRQFHGSVQTKMHGFLNVLGAGILANEHRWHADQTAAMLEDEKASSFSFQDESFSWREWEVATDRIKTHRKLVTSFGSCSFDEPRDDLRALKLS
jgi:hypothetical protein